MKASYALLATANLLLMMLTAVIGFQVDGEKGFSRHFLLGVMACLFTCFVHIVLFMYFVVQEKVLAQAIRQHDLDISYHPQIQAFKSRALRLSLLGILSVIVTGSLGAAIEIRLDPGVHLVSAFVAILINAIVFYFQYALVHDYGGMFHAAFGE
ncbi:MAG: hypothetical protein MI923_06730 [Phycisphaerales bacterium]|nr:hypothetical protein [Phycisphaerales bacterium]